MRERERERVSEREKVREKEIEKVREREKVSGGVREITLLYLNNIQYRITYLDYINKSSPGMCSKCEFEIQKYKLRTGFELVSLRLPSTLLKGAPHVKDWWETYCE